MKPSRQLLVSAAVVATVMGCGGPPKQASPAQPQEEAKSPPRSIELGPTELIQKDPNLGTQWTVKGTSGRVTMQEDGKGSGELDNVSGAIFDNEQVTANYTAKHGKADQAAQTLNLTGNVVVIAKASSAKLVADQVRWLAGRKLIEASGNVTMKTQDYSIGPFPALLATPDLKTFGTPDRFKKP